jgi:hypothetical protein
LVSLKKTLGIVLFDKPCVTALPGASICAAPRCPQSSFLNPANNSVAAGTQEFRQPVSGIALLDKTKLPALEQDSCARPMVAGSAQAVLDRIWAKKLALFQDPHFLPAPWRLFD